MGDVSDVLSEILTLQTTTHRYIRIVRSLGTTDNTIILSGYSPPLNKESIGFVNPLFQQVCSY